MRGHIEKRAKDSWSVVVYLGNKKYKWYTVHGTKANADEFLVQKLKELQDGTLVRNILHARVKSNNLRKL